MIVRVAIVLSIMLSSLFEKKGNGEKGGNDTCSVEISFRLAQNVRSFKKSIDVYDYHRWYDVRSFISYVAWNSSSRRSRVNSSFVQKWKRRSRLLWKCFKIEDSKPSGAVGKRACNSVENCNVSSKKHANFLQFHPSTVVFDKEISLL